MKDSIFGKNVFEVYFDYLVWFIYMERAGFIYTPASLQLEIEIFCIHLWKTICPMLMRIGVDAI